MKPPIPLGFYVSDLAAFGFFMFALAILFLIIAVIIGAVKNRWRAKHF